MAKVVLTAAARVDLREVQHYIAAVLMNPGASKGMLKKVTAQLRALEQSPEAETSILPRESPVVYRYLVCGRVLYAPYTRSKTMEGGHEWWKYVYDEYYDCIICPEYQILKYSTTNRDGYREYKSNPQVCANCPTRALCTRNKDFIKTVTQHIWKPYVDMAEELRYTERHKKYYKMRKETVERVFADAKEKHGMRYTRYTGLAQVTNWVRLNTKI